MFCRNPPNIITSNCFSDPKRPSLISLFNEAKEKNLEVTLYDSFRAGFDVDVKQDLVMAYQYLKIYNLKNSFTYQFLKKNLKLSLERCNQENNREFTIAEKKV